MLTATISVRPPFLIFKGEPTGCIAMCKFSTYPSAGKYACPEKAWMDEEKILV
jgi:hypothetical protein